MTAKERMIAIKLCEKAQRHPDYMKRIGVEISKTKGEEEMIKKPTMRRLLAYLIDVIIISIIANISKKILYKELHPNMSFENRLNCLKSLKELNYETEENILRNIPIEGIHGINDFSVRFCPQGSC